MIHPDTCIKHIDETIGFGVFATAFIPKGTIVYAKDMFEAEVAPEQFQTLPPTVQEVIEKYSYIDDQGIRIVSWDSSKYVNHCCFSNTISTGYGFEIARRDIHPGEEVTDDYGLFNLEYDMLLHCSQPDCRKTVSASDLDHYHQIWDAEIKTLLPYILTVEQPLWPLLQSEVIEELQQFLEGAEQTYRSVISLKHVKKITEGSRASRA